MAIIPLKNAILRSDFTVSPFPRGMKGRDASQALALHPPPSTNAPSSRSVRLGQYIVHFFGNLDEKAATVIRDACHDALDEQADEISIRFSCSGGAVNHGFALYEFLRSLPVPVFTHNTSAVDSIGLVVFLAGERRTARADSRFFIHPLTWSVLGAPLTSIDLVRAREFVQMLEDDTQRYVKVFDEATKGAREPLCVRQYLTGSSAVLSAGAAQEAGIIHEIGDLHIPTGSRIYTSRIPNPTVMGK